MKTQSLLLIAFCCCFAIFMNETISRRAGAPAGRAGDPPAEITCNNGCHTGASLNSGPGSVTLSSDIPETGYMPDSTYTITARAEQSNITRFGFQVLTFGTEANDAVGTTTITDESRTQLMTSGSKSYITHTRDGTDSTNSNTWHFNWTAPATGTGQVVFYGAFVAANANNANSGDQVYATSDTVTESMTTAIASEIVEGHRIYSIPSENNIRIDLEAREFTRLNVTVIGTNGQQYFRDNRHVFIGKYDHLIETNAWSPGVYIILVQTNRGRLFKKVRVY